MAPRLVSIKDGKDLLEALAEATSGMDGWVQATGHVEFVELRVAGDGADPRRSLTGRHTLVLLSGPAGGPFGVVLARDTGAGPTLSAGQLIAARSAGVMACVTRAEAAEFALGVEPARADTSRVATNRAERPAGRGEAPEAPASSWASAAGAAARAAAEPEEEEEGSPEPGDLVHHFAFGLCDVLMASGESLKIRDRTGAGRIREIRIDMLKVLPPTDKDGKRLFKLVRRI